MLYANALDAFAEDAVNDFGQTYEEWTREIEKAEREARRMMREDEA